MFRVHMCSRVHCYAVFLLRPMYVFGLKKTLGIGEIVFFFPSGCLFLYSSSIFSSQLEVL